MGILSFTFFAATCTAIAFVLIQLIVVFPAWRRFRIQKATTSLSKCLKHLNSDSLPNAKIRNGHYLHDKFYRLLFSIYTIDAPKIRSTAGIRYDKDYEREMNQFRREINDLDAETTAIIDEALSSITQILVFHNPVKLFLCLRKLRRSKVAHENGSLKKQMVRSGEYLTVSDKITFDTHCHA